VVVAFVYSKIASPSEMADALGGLKAAFFFVANWYFIRQSVDYFATGIDKSPVLHFWSLAVEEQFYLVWPLLFGGLFFATARLGRFRWWALRAIIAAAAIASLIEVRHIAVQDLSRAYYGTDTRAYQLLAGALLALSPQLLRLGPKLRIATRLAAPLALGGLVLLGSSFFDIGPIGRGIWAVVLTVSLIIGLENRRHGPVARALSARPIAYLGRVSFATYLWHWPIVVIALHSRQVAPIPLFFLSAVASTLLAVLSYHLLERRVRTSALLDRNRVPVIAGALIVTLVGGFVVLPEIAHRDFSEEAVAIGSGTLTKALDWRAAKADIPPLPNCLGKPLTACQVVSGPGKRLLLAGDSNARMWIPTFAAIARAHSMSLTVAAASGCPWQRGLLLDVSSSANADCRKHQDDLYDRILPSLRPDIVVLAHVGYDDAVASRKMIAIGGRHISARDAEFEPDLANTSRSSLEAMQAPGRKVVILEPIPLPPGSLDPLSCISTGTTAAHCAYTSGQSPTGLESFYRSEANANAPFLTSLDVDHLACPRLPVCDEIANGMIVKRDATHLTATYAAYLTASMTTLLERNRVVPAQHGIACVCLPRPARTVGHAQAIVRDDRRLLARIRSS
jgi:peptidoglycan/LPS O-acetylase OafA/YrhL